LIGLIPCARHRLPKFDKESGKVIGQAEHWNLLNIFLRVRIGFVIEILKGK